MLCADVTLWLAAPVLLLDSAFDSAAPVWTLLSCVFPTLHTEMPSL